MISNPYCVDTAYFQRADVYKLYDGSGDGMTMHAYIHHVFYLWDRSNSNSNCFIEVESLSDKRNRKAESFDRFAGL